MRITCTATEKGNVYRFYASDKSSVSSALKPLVPLLLATDAEVILGSDPSDPSLLLRVGPLKGGAEDELLRLASHLPVTRCPVAA